MFHEITVQILVFGNRHLYVAKIIPRLQPFPYLSITSPLPDHLPVLVNFLVKFRPLTVQQPFFPFQDTGSQIIFIQHIPDKRREIIIHPVRHHLFPRNDLRFNLPSFREIPGREGSDHPRIHSHPNPRDIHEPGIAYPVYFHVFHRIVIFSPLNIIKRGR